MPGTTPETWGQWEIITTKGKPSQKQVMTVSQSYTDITKVI